MDITTNTRILNVFKNNMIFNLFTNVCKLSSDFMLVGYNSIKLGYFKEDIDFARDFLISLIT